MATDSMKYFQDHVNSSVFCNQVFLADVLEQVGKRSLVESDEISPLTLRMFKIQHGLTEIENCVLHLRPLTFPVIFNQQGCYKGTPTNGELFGTVAPSGSIEYVHSYLTQKNDLQNDPFQSPPVYNFRFGQAGANQIRIINDNTKVHTFSLHSGIYDFFVNLDSTLDRIRLELNSVYFDGCKALYNNQTKGNRYWFQYLDVNNKAFKDIEAAGYTGIAEVLVGTLSKSIDQRTSKYRNRLIHDGDLEVLIEKQSGKVLLPIDPLATPLVFSVDLLPYVQSIFSDIQVLFRDIYAEMIKDLANKRRVPLI